MGVVIACAGCSRHGETPPSHRDEATSQRDAGAIVARTEGASEPTPSQVARRQLGDVPAQMDLFDASHEDAASSTKATRLGCLSVPLGATEPRPIMVALHGGSDRPEWACNAWRGITDAYPFLVCPRGVGLNEDALAWSSPVDTKARVARAVDATRSRFREWIREGPVVLVGFSMGATQAALLAQGDPVTYPRIALAESAYAPEPVMAFARPWTTASVGGAEQRAVFLCTTPGCEAPYRKAARNVAMHHVAARLNIAGTTEHGMWEVVVRSMRRDWPWLVEGAAGWDAYVPPQDQGLPGRTEVFEARDSGAQLH
jgi:poly(3-hydroxybutyrate) depolymerase